MAHTDNRLSFVEEHLMPDILEIRDLSIARALQAHTADMLDGPFDLNMEWIKEHGWIVVPVEKGRHFDEAPAARAAQAMQHMGDQQCYAIATEPEIHDCYI